MVAGAGLDVPLGGRALSSRDELSGGGRLGRPREGSRAPGRNRQGAPGYRRPTPGRLQEGGERCWGLTVAPVGIAA